MIKINVQSKTSIFYAKYANVWFVLGNFFEDSLAHYRSSLGLPAIAINWGQWGQVS